MKNISEITKLNDISSEAQKLDYNPTTSNLQRRLNELNSVMRILRVIYDNILKEESDLRTEIISLLRLRRIDEAFFVLMREKYRQTGEMSDSGLRKIVEVFLAEKTDLINAKDIKGHTGLYYALNEISIETAELFLRKGTNPIFANKNGSSYLHLICCINSLELFNLLIQNILNAKQDLNQILNLKDNLGQTPLHNICFTKNKEIGELLIKFGAELNIRDNYGCTPLHHACFTENKEIVELLIKYKAELNIKENRGYNSLHIACSKKYLEIANLLLMEGVDVNSTNYYEDISLHIACVLGDKLTAELLINHKSKLNAKNNSGCTPLHYACRWGFIDVIKLLVREGADINIENEKGETPLNLLSEAKKLELYNSENLVENIMIEDVNLQIKSSINSSKRNSQEISK